MIPRTQINHEFFTHAALANIFSYTAWLSVDRATRRTYQSDLLHLMAAGYPLALLGLSAYLSQSVALWSLPGQRGIGYGRAAGMISAIHKFYAVNAWDRPSGEDAHLTAVRDALRRSVAEKVLKRQMAPKVDYGAMTRDLFTKFLARAETMAKQELWDPMYIRSFKLCWAMGLRINEVEYVCSEMFCDAQRDKQKVLLYTALAHKNSLAKAPRTIERIVDAKFADEIRQWLREQNDDSAQLLPGWSRATACAYFSKVTDAMLAEKLIPAEWKDLKWSSHSMRNGAACTVYTEAAKLSENDRFKQVGNRTGHASRAMQEQYARDNRRRVQDRIARISGKASKVKKGKAAADFDAAAEVAVDAEQNEMEAQMRSDLEALLRSEEDVMPGKMGGEDLETDDEEDLTADQVRAAQPITLDDVAHTDLFATCFSEHKIRQYISRWQPRLVARGTFAPTLATQLEMAAMAGVPTHAVSVLPTPNAPARIILQGDPAQLSEMTKRLGQAVGAASRRSRDDDLIWASIASRARNSGRRDAPGDHYS